LAQASLSSGCFLAGRVQHAKDMTLALTWLLVLGSGLVALCSADTLRGSSGKNSPGNDKPETMLTDLETTASKIMPGVTAEAVFPTVTVEGAFKRLSKSYGGAAMQSHAITVDREEIQRNFQGENSQAAVYGELIPPSAAAMIEFAVKHNPNIVWDGKEHKRYEVNHGTSEARPKFVDLGSGFGKISMLAALLGFDAAGYELAHPRIGEACKAVGELAGKSGWQQQALKVDQSPAPREVCSSDASQVHGQINFFEGSFTHDSVKLEDADVIFTDSVFWDEGMMKALGEKASKMKLGSIIFSYKAFPGDAFESLESLHLPTSWSSGTPWKVQKVVKK